MIAHKTMGSVPNTGRGTMTANRLRINLGKDAVKLALEGQWARAAEINRAILELHPDDCEAANRLTKALMELGDYAAAREVLADLREKHPLNGIARKNLARLEKLESAGGMRQAATASAAGLSPTFIADGGKSCTTVLRRAHGDELPDDIGAGDAVSLSVADDSLVAESAEGRPLGSVEPRLARRLRRLIAGGNRYSAAVVGVNGDAVSIIIRETELHPSLRGVVSFPPTNRIDDAAAQDPDRSTTLESANAEVLDSADDAATDAEPEEVPDDLIGDEVDDDGAEESDVGVPVLDADDVDSDPILEIVPPKEEEDDWE